MTDKPEDPELIELVPVEMSQSGRNAYYQFCDARQQQVSYAVCLHTIDAYERQSLGKDQFTDCQRYLCRDECPAKHMRNEEIKAGHALYFKERPSHVYESTKKVEVEGAVSSGKYDMSNPGYARGWAMVGQRLGADDPAPKPKSKPTRNIGPIKKKDSFVTEDMGAVLTEMVKAESEKPAAVAPTPSTEIKPLPGESTLDFIKRKQALQKGK